MNKILIVAAFCLFGASLCFSSKGESRGHYATIDGKTYFIGTDNGGDAFFVTESCNQLNMSLVSLESQVKDFAISNYLISLGSGSDVFWTSGVRLLDGFIWSSTGTTFDYTRWAPAQPDLIVGEECVCLIPGAGIHDIGCSSSALYICQV